MATPRDAFDYLSNLQDRIDRGENPVQDMMTGYRNAVLQGACEASRRQFIDVNADTKIYYRKMSQAEWTNCSKGQGKFDFAGIFKFNTGNNYRWWVSSSRDKCVLFGNEAATTQTDVIVMFVFSADLTAVFKPLKAHQMRGIQASPQYVAIHREGFPSLGVGNTQILNMHSDEDVKQVLESGKSFNLGFTAQQAAQLNQYLERCEKSE